MCSRPVRSTQSDVIAKKKKEKGRQKQKPATNRLKCKLSGSFCFVLNKYIGTGEMAQWFRELCSYKGSKFGSQHLHRLPTSAYL